MGFTVKPIKEFYLLDTKVENIFINEFMTAAPGDYVKVYLLSLMYANAGIETDNAGIAKQLSLEEEDVLKAWNYWEGLSAIKKEYKDPGNKFKYDVEFLCIKEQLYGKRRKKSGTDSKLPANLSDTELTNMYHSIERITGRLLGGKEPTEIISWISDYGASPEAIVYAYSYCVKNRKKSSCQYVGTVLREWMSKQLFDIAKIEEYLQDIDERYFLHKRVMKALGLTRNATEKEKHMMDTWFDEMGFGIDKVLEACGTTSGISNPNFNYVNKVLSNWSSGKSSAAQQGKSSEPKAISIADVQRYYDFIRKQAEDAADKRRDEIYTKIREVKDIDAQLRLCGMEMSKIMISRTVDKTQLIAKYRDKVSSLSAQKLNLLNKNGYTSDYLETKYRCEVCKDSGMTDDGERCNCFQEVQNEAKLWQISSKK